VTPAVIPALSVCDSPIEGRLLQAMFDNWNFNGYIEDLHRDDVRPRISCLFWTEKTPICVFVQTELRDIPYRRVDFVIEGMCCKFIVEADGVQFHKNERVMREDRKKDRIALLMGYNTLRFVGPEIWQYPKFALGQIEQTCANLTEQNFPAWRAKIDTEQSFETP